MKLLPLIPLTLLTVTAFLPQGCYTPNAPLEETDQYAKYDCVNLLDSTHVEVKENGSGTFTIRKIIKVQNQAGALRNRIIKYDYDPLTAFAEFKQVTIRKADGTTHPVDVKKTCDYAAPARAIYWGARQIMLPLENLQAGDIIDYEISKKGFTYALLATPGEYAPGAGTSTSAAPLDGDDDRFVPPMQGHFYDIVPFWSSDPTIRKVYQVAIPQEKGVQYEFYQGKCNSSVQQNGDKKVYTFSKDNITPFQQEPNMVDLFDVAPKLMISTTAHWKEKSLWFNKVNEDYGSFEPTPEAQAKVNQLTKNCKTEMEKIAVLTHWVADNIRYSGISMGKGEGYTLHNTKTNFTDRCGVCKDKAALLISMLRMAGLEAYPAMTMAGSRIESIPADHFNHCVTVVKLSNGTYMPLDPTWVPFLRELWSSAEQQQNYLPGIPEGSDLCLTPLSAPENHYFRIKANSTLTAEGTLEGEFTLMAEGQSDGSVRRTFTSGFMSEWYNALERELLNVSPNAQLISVDYGNNPKDYVAAPIKITMKYIIPGYAMQGKSVLAFKPLVLNNLYYGPRSYMRIDTSLKNRKYGFRDACSRLVELDETIRLPKGYTLVQPAREEEKQSEAADFSGYIRQEDDQVRLYHKLVLKKRIYKATDWEGFRDAVTTHKSFAEQPLIIKKN